MKKIFLGILVMSLFYTANAQQKINWVFAAKKMPNNTYELRMTATPPSGWHIYSQTTPDGGPIPTEFKFTSNALLTVTDKKPKEEGKLVTYFDKNFKVDVKYFADVQ